MMYAENMVGSAYLSIVFNITLMFPRVCAIATYTSTENPSLALIMFHRVVSKMQLSAFGERLAKLRLATGISARDMSLSMGMSANYINKIENNKTLPSMATFFDICDYLEIEQKDFFDENNKYPDTMNNLVDGLKKLDKKALSNIEGLVNELNRSYFDLA